MRLNASLAVFAIPWMALASAPQLDSTRKAELKALERRVLAIARTAPDSAEPLALEYIELSRNWDHEVGIAQGKSLLAAPLTMRGDHAGALTLYLDALVIYERTGSRSATAMTHGNIANAYAEQDLPDKAVAEYRQAVQGFHELHDALWEAGMAQELAKVYQRMGAADSASLYFGRAADMMAAGGSPEHAAMARYGQARALPAGTPARKRSALYRDALALLGAAGDEPVRCEILLALGESILHGDPRASVDTLRLSLDIAQRLKLTSTISDAHKMMSDAFDAQGSLDSALAHLRAHVLWKDRMYSEDRTKAMAEAEQRYRAGRKDLEIERNMALLERRETAIRAIAMVAALALLAGLFAYRAYRIKKRGAEELARKNAVINEQLREKEVLLREIHHRVKNNLQTITSLLRLQSRSLRSEEGRAAIEDAMSRVRSMALIHQDLYRRPDLTSVDMGAYMTKLTNALLRSHGMEQRIEAHVEVGALELDVEPAVTLGLVANELITNALKHAFPDERSGALWITLTEEGEEIRLEVRDNGIGFEPGAVTIAKEGAASGVDIVHAMAGALQAELSIKREAGTLVRLSFRHNNKVA